MAKYLIDAKKNIDSIIFIEENIDSYLFCKILTLHKLRKDL